MADVHELENRRLGWFVLQVVASHTIAAAIAEKVFTTEGFAFPGLYGAVEFGTFALTPLLSKLLREGPRAALRLLPRLAAEEQREEALLFGLCGL
ncbi:unnamed protein product, partial [Polarella glacialis]